jgi:hypothetical protein
MGSSFSPNPVSFGETDVAQTATLTIHTSCTTPSGTRTITVKATGQNSGDLATSSATMSVVGDTTPPQVICPPTTTVSCAAAVPAHASSLLGFVNQGGSVSDNCSGVIVSWSSDVTNSLSCPNRFVITRTYFATDMVGNTAPCTQKITVNAVTPPLIASFPADLTVSCAAAVPPANDALVTASDNCGGNVTISHDPDALSNQTCPNHFTLTRTYHATDACGNIASQSQTITVNDTTPPLINSFPADLSVSCAAAVPLANDTLVTATDDCGGNVTISHDPDAFSNQTCPNRFTLTRTYHATDACGNIASQSQTITVNDTTPPLITSFPADLTLSCASAVPPANDTLVTATDNCGGTVGISHDPDVVSNQTCPNRFTVTRTYHATDACGNVASQSQTIIVNDITPPLITSFPADLTLSCASAVPPANDTLVAVTDNCGGNVTISHDPDNVSNQTCPNHFTLTRTYHATDACGNVTSQSQTITVNDTTSPLITSFPTDLSVSCPGAVPPADDLLVAATDNCGAPVTITHDPDTITPGTCAGHLTIRRTYHAADACGNVASQSQLITVDDETAPTITSFPSNATVSCAAAVPLADDSLVSATDNCGGAVTVTHDPDVVSNQSCPNRLTITRTYHATDACGNVATQSQLITVDDETAPTITSFPSDATVSCAAAVPLADDSLVSATDNCGGTVIVTHDPDVVSNQTCPNRFSISRTYHATEACGNVTSQSQTITVNANTPPIITAFPADTTVSCVAAVPSPDDSLVNATDNCGGAVAVTHDPDAISNQTCPNRFTLARTYRVTDACGNSTSDVQLIIVDDETPPVITAFPADKTVSCRGSIPAPDDTLVSATDNCGGAVTVTHDPDTITPGACAGHLTIRRTYHAADACGNTSSQSQLITVDDETAPTITSFPSDATVSCAAAVPLADDNLISASDNCGGAVTVAHDPDVVSNQTCPNQFTITRTYRAADACGNAVSQSQLITVNDKVPPVMVATGIAPAYRSVADAQAAALAATTATDECSGTIALTVSTAGTCDAIVTVTATDSCGNASAVSYHTRVENSPPVLFGCPSDASYALSADVPPPATVTASDACNGSVTVTFSQFETNPGSSGTDTITRTWTAVDAAGNTATCSQTILVNHGEAPSITVIGANPMIVVLGSTFIDPGCSASDSLGQPLAVAVSGTVNPAAVGTYLITYTATDAFGNQASGTRIVYVQYEPAGISCDGSSGHAVLPPINTDGSSLFQQGRTIPIKFRVFDADCTSVGTPGVVSGFSLVLGPAGVAKKSHRALAPMASDAGFVWDPKGQEWIYNLDTSGLIQGNTYVYQITLNDGTAIQFGFSLK